MTKVCHMTSVHPQDDTRIFHKECTSLAQMGYEVYLVSVGGSYDKNGVHVVGVGQPSGGRLKRMLYTTRKVYEAALAVNADIYHLHDPELLPYGLKLKRRGKKVVFDSHEDYSVILRDKPYLPKWVSLCIALIYSRYEKYVLRRIDGLIFPCLINGKHPFAGQCRHLTTVDNFPLLSELYDHYDDRIPKIERSLVYIGLLTFARGITHSIQVAEMADCTLYLGGRFVTPAYQAEAEALPAYSHVQYLGTLSRPKVLETLQKCQIGMAVMLHMGQAGIYDNMPTKVYEYMSLGLPVILSRLPYNESLMEKYHFGICVDPTNLEEIASAARYLFDHPEEARQMGENGRRTIKEVFNWDSQEKNLLALYQEILNEEAI